MELDVLAIGLRLRKHREKMKLSREKLAEIVGISEYYIGQLERGQRQMSLAVACAFADCLHISLDYLIWGDQRSYDLLLEHAEPYNLSDRRQEIYELLNRCSDNELEFVQNLLRLILPYLGRQMSDSRKDTYTKGK